MDEEIQRKHPLSKCEDCPYRESGGFVPTQFPQRPIKLAIVGEAPGFYEAAQGKPFTGPSGKLLDTVLGHYKVRRDEVLLTNACLCRPSGNATPPKAAVVACRDRLHDELSSSGADRIIALGGTASSVLVDDSRTITSLRIGPPKDATYNIQEINPDAKVVATWHPAYCLRSPDAFPSMVSDFGKFYATQKHWAEPDWRYYEDPDAALHVLDVLQKRTDRLVIDIETGKEKDADAGHPEQLSLLCVGIAFAAGKAVVIGEEALQDTRVVAKLGELLRSVRIIAHNGKYDIQGLQPHIGWIELYFDTMLANYAIDERPGGHGLKVLAVEKLGAPQYDLEIRKYVPRGGNYADIPRPILYKYNAYDVICTWALYEGYERDLGELRVVHDFLIRASNELMRIEFNGFPFDLTYNSELEKEYVQDLAASEERIDNLVRKDEGWENGINPRSPIQIRKWLEHHGIKTDTTNADTLGEMLKKQSLKYTVRNFIGLLLAHRRSQKLYSVYIKSLAGKVYRGKVYTSFLLHASTSGRLASRDPNLQNVVRDNRIRKQFTVEHDDNTLIQCDYSQAEGRVIATLAKDEYLAEIFRDSGRDLFNELTSQIYGGPNWGDEERTKVKTFFYGLSYGREAASIAVEFDMPLEEAQDLLRKFKALIPATVLWQAKIRHQVLSGQGLKTTFGRTRNFYLITDQNKRDVINEALSFVPQSTASDICLSALIQLRPKLERLAQVRLTIHDAIIVECHKDNAAKVADIMQDTMIEAGREWNDYVPFDVEIKSGQNWGDLKRGRI